MILIDEGDYISKVKIARIIAEQYADFQNRMNVPEERQTAMDGLLNISDTMGVYRMVLLVLKVEYKIVLESNAGYYKSRTSQ